MPHVSMSQAARFELSPTVSKTWQSAASTYA